MPYSELLEPRYSELLAPETYVHTETKPRPDSLDSGQEFSLDHLRELYTLLEMEDPELDGYVFDDACLLV